MTKRKFNNAGNVGVSTNADLGIGWTFRAQRAYVRGRFNRVDPFPCPIYNAKVEQVMRAIVAVEAGNFSVLTDTAANKTSLHYNYPPETVFQIGRLTADGAVLHPNANSALAILGLNGNAVLHHLGGMRLVDELTGMKLQVIENDGEFIYTTNGFLQRLAHDCVFHKEAILNAYMGYRRVKSK